MRLIGVCTARNERDVIEAFVRHNLQYLDHLIVLDHASTDGSLALLQALQTEGLTLSLRRNRAPAFDQPRLVQSMVEEAFTTLHADHVFALDADEFLHVASRAALEQALAAVPAGDLASLRWQTYVADERRSAEPLLARMRLRPRQETSEMRKVAIPRIAHAEHWQVATGNHAARYFASGQWHQPELIDLADVYLAHLPLRSPQQALSKALVGWLSWQLSYGNVGLLERTGWHWRQWSERFVRDGATPSWRELRNEALRVYAFDREQGDFDADAIELIEDPIEPPPGLAAGDVLPDAARNIAAWSVNMVQSILTDERNRQAKQASKDQAR